MSVVIKNTGNGFSKPFGRVSINRGNKEVQGYEFNNSDPKGNVLPASTREFEDSLKGMKMPGRYTVAAQIAHGSKGEVLIASTSFWYLPTWSLVALGVVTGLALLAAVWFLVRGKIGGKRSKL